MYTFTLCPYCLGCKYYKRGSIMHYFLFSQQPARHISYRWEILKLWDVERSGPSLWAEGIRGRSTRLHASAGLRGGSHCLGYLLPGFLPDLCDSDEVICSLPAFWNLLCSGPGAPITLYPCCSVVTCQASESFTISQSLLKLMSIELMMPSNYLILCHPPALNLSQHQGLFKWVSSSYQVVKVLEFQLQHQSFQWIFRTNLL